jgi:hypothetical protein
MIDTWHLVHWIRAALAIVVALALFAGPLGNVRATEHEGTGFHGAVTAMSKPIKASTHCNGPSCRHNAANHGACCGNMCSFCAAAIATVSAALPELAAANQRYEQGDQLFRGVVFPPPLGPPRRQA